MVKSYLESSNIISSLGWNTAEALSAVLSGIGGISSHSGDLSDTMIPASLVDWKELDRRFGLLSSPDEYTRFEKMGILSVGEALSDSEVDPLDPRTVMIVATTKGNVELLEEPGEFESDRLLLWKSAEIISGYFGMKNRPLVISNACISGVAAMIMAGRLIGEGRFDHAIVLGEDVVSRFIVSGFQSFLSLSDSPCKPFDKERDGLTLGEAAATVVISRHFGEVELLGGAISNDANHISGPSRTGEGLLMAINKTIEGKSGIDAISAHGTATIYNDEMESIAISRAGLESVPVNSLKGNFGHTLGAAGVLESVINVEAMKQGILVPTLGYQKSGVSGSINIQKQAENRDIDKLLKIASGFGGSNAAALFGRR
jgi:3-oxoacyl-[acyl-carrier-protein] synthase-1